MMGNKLAGSTTIASAAIVRTRSNMANTTHKAKIDHIIKVLKSGKPGNEVIKELGEPIVVMLTLAEAIKALQDQVAKK